MNKPMTEAEIGRAMLALARSEGHAPSHFVDRKWNGPTAPKASSESVAAMRALLGGNKTGPQIVQELGLQRDALKNKLHGLKKEGLVEIVSYTRTGKWSTKTAVWQITRDGRKWLKGYEV